MSAISRAPPPGRMVGVVWAHKDRSDGSSLDTISVHIFSTRYREADCGPFVRTLSEDELVKAARFRFEADRVRSIVCRSMLRRLTAAQFGGKPEEIEYSLVMNGKPTIVHPPEAAKIHVNVSHSGDLGAVALSVGSPLGVDIEFMRRDIEIAAIAKYYFRKEERSWLDSLPKRDQLRGFHRLWVLKESILKASGDGLSIPLDLIPVHIEGEIVRTGPYPAVELNVPSDYCAAVSACATQMPRVNLCLWPDGYSAEQPHPDCGRVCESQAAQEK